MKNPFKKKNKPKLPPKFDEFTDLANEQGFDAAIAEVHLWINEEPDEPAYFRYLATAHQQLNNTVEQNSAAAWYFLLKNDAVTSKGQRALRVEADGEWINSLLNSEQEYKHAAKLFHEIVQLTDGVNRKLNLKAMSRLLDYTQLSTSELVELISSCHRAQDASLGVRCLDQLEQAQSIDSIEPSVQADLYYWGGEYDKARAVIEPLTDSDSVSREHLVLLAECYLYSNRLKEFGNTLQRIFDIFGTKASLEQAMRAITMLVKHDAELLPIATIRERVGEEVGYSYTLQEKSARRAWFINGPMEIDGDLALDMSGDNYPTGTIGFDLIVNSNLKVTGSVTNFCGDTGCALIVNGDLEAEHLIGGGSEVVIVGDTRLHGVLIGHYNHGSITLQQSLTTKLIWNDDHSLNFGFRQDPAITINVAQEIDCNHDLLPLLQEEFRAQVTEIIHRDYKDDIKEEGEDFKYPLYFSEYVAPELLAGRSLSALIRY